MKGTVKCIRESKNLYGFIVGTDGEEYYFNDQLLDKTTYSSMSDFSAGDEVEFRAGNKPLGGSRPDAYNVRLTNAKSPVQTSNPSVVNSVVVGGSTSKTTDIAEVPDEKKDTQEIIAYYTPGYSLPLQRDLQIIEREHLKPGSGEIEVLDKLSKLLYISRIGSHNIGGRNSLYQFCLDLVTEIRQGNTAAQDKIIHIHDMNRNKTASSATDIQTHAN